MKQTALFANNMITIQAYEWFKQPHGENPLYIPQAPYHIKQLHNPLTWDRDVGISRPEGWKTNNVGVLAQFNALYRTSRRYSAEWHHWIYLSANKYPLNETWNEDPWDKAFLELLQHRDEYEQPQGRRKFNYIACPGSFLCSMWRVDGPAMIHFTTGPLERNHSQLQSLAPFLEPVHVRVFDLPLNESVIPGRFPTHFEQLRSITASNSTYWTKKKEYSYRERILLVQVVKVLEELEDTNPKTVGMLAKGGEKWAKFVGENAATIIVYGGAFAMVAGGIPSYYGTKFWDRLQMWRINRKYGHSPEAVGNKRVGPDPVAQQLQGFLDTMTDEDKERWSKTYKGGIILDRIQKGLEKKDWDGRDDVVAAIEDAVGH
ncbi:unnamed protein product [Fusarium equiseti]|uniref:Uncharacterized protein n=1 Tax=Fusarium equiseti TaxID=61235 RepID=A0A8J2NH24_FUSEQ|nr:unnamed protein product [Fusarium equiseti]